MNAGANWDFALAFAVVLASMPVLIHFAPRLGLMDRPDSRKQHGGDVPMVGGLAVFMAMLIVLGVRHFNAPGIQAMLAGGLLLLGIGVVDDRNHISPRYRFLVQIIAAGLMIFVAGVLLADFGRLVGNFVLPLWWFAIPLTAFCVVGVTNATNMIDGMDGLSSCLVLVALAGLALAARQSGLALENVPQIPVLAGAVLAYLLFNLRLPWRGRALAFYGDAGTLVIGFVVAWLMVGLSQGTERVIAPVTALWLFAVPLMDTVFLMIQRKLAGLSVAGADRQHLHHAFLRSGWGVNPALIAIVTVAAVLAAAGLAMELAGVAEFVSFYAFLGVCAVYYSVMGRVWNQRRFLGRKIE